MGRRTQRRTGALTAAAVLASLAVAGITAVGPVGGGTAGQDAAATVAPLDSYLLDDPATDLGLGPTTDARAAILATVPRPTATEPRPFVGGGSGYRYVH